MNGSTDLATNVELGRKELEDAFAKTFDDDWIDSVKEKLGPAETLELMRRIQRTVQTARAQELSRIAEAMRANETKLAGALADIEKAKAEVEDIARSVQLISRLVGVFEQALKLAATL
jgi:hypothetical protein